MGAHDRAWTRRAFLGAVGGAGLALAGCGLPFGDGNGGQRSSGGDAGAEPAAEGDGTPPGRVVPSEAPLPEPFTRPLAIPPELRPSSTDGPADVYDVTVGAATAGILPGLTTPIAAYNGTFPGPTIRSRRGRPVTVRTRNALPVPIVTHLHGGRTPQAGDGYPTDYVLPAGGWPSMGGHDAGARHDQRFDYEYPLDQRAATLWYHDHRMDFTGPSVWRGLVGMHLHSDDEEAALPLPRGEREVPLILTDRSFAADGAFAYPALDPEMRTTPGVEEAYNEGVLGDVLLVNGVPWPYLEVAAVKYRFRVLNASNARQYALTLDPVPGDGFVQIGSDGGLLAAPVRQAALHVAPAERFDVVVDFGTVAPGTTVRLHNDIGEGRMREVMEFRVTGPAGDPSRIPSRLASGFETLTEDMAVRRRSFSFLLVGEGGPSAMWKVGNRAFDPGYIAADPKLGDVELWQFNGQPNHPVHLHCVNFQVLGRPNRGEVRPTDVGWKDTVLVRGSEVVKVLVRFDGYAGKYVFHCHNLEHEDMAMMANFTMS